MNRRDALLAVLAFCTGVPRGARGQQGKRPWRAKALALLVEALPRAKRIGVLGNSSNAFYRDSRREIDELAAQRSIILLPTAEAKRVEDLDAAFAQIARDKPQGLFMVRDALFFVHRKRILDFAAQARIPTMHGFTEDVEAGGLMAFATRYRDLYARAPVFVDKILKGAKPANIPIEEPTRFGLWANMKTARALGVKFPPAVLARAEQLIE